MISRKQQALASQELGFITKEQSHKLSRRHTLTCMVHGGDRIRLADTDLLIEITRD